MKKQEHAENIDVKDSFDGYLINSKKDIKTAKEFITVYVEGWQIECCGAEQPFIVGDNVDWYARELKKDFIPYKIGKVDYIYESHGAPDILEPCNAYLIKGKISKIYNYYCRAKSNTEIHERYGEFACEVKKAQRWNDNSDNSLPFAGWGVVLENAIIENVYSDEEIETYKERVKNREKKERRKAKLRGLFGRIEK